MSTPRYFAPFAACAALFLAPATSADTTNPQQVTIEIDFEAAPEAVYESIREQAWQVCKPDLGSTYASARNRLRRACQQQIVADVMSQLAQRDEIQLAATEKGDAQ